MSARPASRFERHPALTLSAFVAFLLALVDLGGTRVYAIFRPDFYREHSVFRVKSDIYHHGFKPNVSTDRDWWGPLVSSYRINSLGLRDRAVREVPLSSDKRRVMFIGDSFTEGIGVPYERTFVGLVDQALAAKGIEVENAGAASYCPIIYYRRVKNLIEEVGLHIDELVVMIDIGDIQDEVTYRLDDAGNVAFRQRRFNQENSANWYFGKPRFLAHEGVHNFLRKHMLVSSTVYEALLAAFSRGPRRAAAWTMDGRVFDAYGREGVAAAQEHMSQLAEMLARHHVRLTVGVYPWPDQVLAHDIPSRQETTWRDWAASHGAGFIDCFPTFMDGDGKERVRDEYIRGDIHWNEAGHARMAAAILAQMSSAEQQP